MSEIFKTNEHVMDIVDWLTGTGSAINMEGRDVPGFYSQQEFIPDDIEIKSWHGNSKKQWRVSAMKEGGVAKCAAVLATLLQNKNGFKTFEDVVKYTRDHMATLDEFRKPASHSEIADALATLADVLDQSIPDAMASFIIEEIAETEAPSAAVWKICRHIAANESGRIKPSLFRKFISNIYNRNLDVGEDLREFSKIHECFDEALAMALENEPTLMIM